VYRKIILAGGKKDQLINGRKAWKIKEILLQPIRRTISAIARRR
jgi:hypothetical protein